MACGSQEVVSVPLMVKLNKISTYLSSFQAEKLPFRRNSLLCENADVLLERNDSTKETGTIHSEQQKERITANPSPTSDKIKAYYCSDVNVPSKLPLSSFWCRLKTFGDITWMLPISLLSVYECARRGWYLLQNDMLCCSCCNQMVCLTLPPSHSSSYSHAVSILRERVFCKHRGNCRYLSCPDPVSVCFPPSLLTTPHLYILAAAAHQIASLSSSPTGGGSRLPYLENGGQDVMNRLDVSSSLLQEVSGSVCEDEWQHVAVLLVLCGWKATTAPDTIRCELCQRSIGLWHFLSYAEHQEREAAVTVTASVEIEQPNTETPVVDSQNSEAVTKNAEDLSLRTGGDSETAQSDDQLPVERRDCETNEGAEEVKDGNESNRQGEGDSSAGATNNGQETDNTSDANQKSVSNKDDENTNVLESESGNKRKRSECEDESNEEAQSSLVPGAEEKGSEAMPSKRSKPNDNEQSSDVAEPSLASVEETTSTSDVPQVTSKALFCPFSQHRYWCGWITSEKEHLLTNSDDAACSTHPSNNNTAVTGPGLTIHAGDVNSGAHGSEGCHGNATGSPENVPLDTLPGYAVFARQLKSVLQLAQRKQWTTSDKYSNTIEGLRSVRAHLNSWAK